MTIKAQYHFNTDAPCVKQAWEDEPNMLIQDFASPKPQQSYCAIYFSSNDIYFPNTEDVFRKRIVEKNTFEWYGTRIAKATKHIFVRDVFKQWYIRGINAQCNNIEALAALLKEEAKGMKVVTVGSSAGGYAAIVLGSLLQAEYVLAFNAQLDINLIAPRNPFVARYQNTKWGGTSPQNSTSTPTHSISTFTLTFRPKTCSSAMPCLSYPTFTGWLSVLRTMAFLFLKWHCPAC